MADAIFFPEAAKPERWPIRDTVHEEIRNAGPGGHFADPGLAAFFASIHPWRWRDPQWFVEEPEAVERTPWHQDPLSWPPRGPSATTPAAGDPRAPEAFPLISPKELCRL